MRGELTAHMDVAQVVLHRVHAVFRGAGLLSAPRGPAGGLPARGRGRRATSRPATSSGSREPKTFLRADGRKVLAPNYKADERPINARKAEPWPGAPLTPTGDPLLADVGPGSYAARRDEPYKTADGHDLLAPLRVATNFAVPAEGANPVGFEVVGERRRRRRRDHATCGSTAPNRSCATTRWSFRPASASFFRSISPTSAPSGAGSPSTP